jgi:ADP-heptose:LPS heptosyltransferase
LFAGAGGDSKRWPLERWVILADRIRTQWPAAAIELLAGPVELERWPDAERCRFESASGRIVGPDGDLSSLARLLGMARLYIGGDTGPTHLAAQLGIPTIALFGPTDPAVWAPVGPRVCVLAPSALSEMAWLSVDVVFASARSVSQA